jgi:hypothetical protein
MIDLDSWSVKPPREMLLEYLTFCRGLMYEDEETVRWVTNVLRRSISEWASERSEVYKGFSGIISKSELEDKQKWYVGELYSEWQRTSTSGSTTGRPFEYLRWGPSFDALEWGNHYDLVLDEFGMPAKAEVMYFFSDYYKSQEGKYVLRTGRSEVMLNNHGASRDVVVHHVNFDMFKSDQEGFFSYLFEYLKDNPVDVLFTSGPQIRSMCNYIAKLGVNHKLGRLLSNTNERLIPEDVIFLAYDNSHFDSVCDHMRCWDGGASFFTCRFGNYHLMDNLSWCEEVDGKMVSTDYFNLCSPFVNYWNGDYCKISDSYQRCECGRLFREFEFLESRPFSIKGVCVKELQNKIEALNIDGIRQVKCSVSCLDVVSNRALTDEEKASIERITDKFEFKFNVEKDYNS